MFGKHSASGYQEVLPGISIKTLNHGSNMIMMEFLLTKDSVLPEHQHVNEQIGYLVTGRIRLHIDGVSKIIEPGDSWNIAGNIRHKADILEDSVAIEVFNPVREDYLKYIHTGDLSE